jgi:Tol biopolymer transport system component
MLLPVLAIAALLVIPAMAHATLAYVKYGRYPFAPLIFTATDDGLEEVPVARGWDPRISPDGDLVAYLSQVTPGGRERLKVVSADGGASNLLMDARQISHLAWSPDSSRIAAVRSSGRGPDRLVLINVPSGGERVVARGRFSGVSFSPGGGELVYSGSPAGKPGFRDDVYRIATHGRRSVRLTDDHRSLDPLWGPNGQIAFVRKVGRRPKYELFLMQPDGGSVQRLTHTRVGPRQRGLFPVAWSADGGFLLANFSAPRSHYAVIVDPVTHGAWAVRSPKHRFVGSAFSCDGNEVLGSSGRVGPLADHLVGTVASEGGRMSVLAEFAYEPDWGSGC